MQFNFESDTPIYIQVAEQIKDAILSGAFLEETQVPSTTEISRNLQNQSGDSVKGNDPFNRRRDPLQKRRRRNVCEKGCGGNYFKQRKNAFYNSYIVRLLEEAKKLSISQQEIIRMIEEGPADEKRD